jgi:hypothetical protein
MEREIIQTEDPNIVIERTTIDKEIDIGEITSQIQSYTDRIVAIDFDVEQLNQSKQLFPDFIVIIIEEKIINLLSEKATANYQIELLNNELNKLN